MWEVVPLAVRPLLFGLGSNTELYNGYSCVRFNTGVGQHAISRLARRFLGHRF